MGGLNWESTGAVSTAQHTYAVADTYQAIVRVTDNQGAIDTENISIVVTEPSIEGLKVFGLLVYLDGFNGIPIPDVAIHLKSKTGDYDETVMSGSVGSGFEGQFEFTNVPEGEIFEMWGDDPAWLWPGPRFVPNSGVLTEDMDAGWLTTNGPS